MKLQKHFAYSYKGKKRYKNVIVIPQRTILRLGWKQGQKLETEIKESALIVRPVGKTEGDKNK